MKDKRKIVSNKCRFLLPGDLKPYLDSFSNKLSDRGYTETSIESYYSSISHFGTWLQKQSIPLETINANVIAKFSKHRCICVGILRKNKISHRYIKRIQYFVHYLQQGTLEKIKAPKILPSLAIKFIESLSSAGLSDATIKCREMSIAMLLPLLGNNPKKYNAKIVRETICKLSKKCGLVIIKRLTTTLRLYLRFLIVEGQCRPNLDAAVPVVAHWKLSSLPKYIVPDEVERVIASCNVNTKQGLRNQAILLLLARLGLRAGDITNMVLDDINWSSATLRISGKGRRETLLPLSQEVGDALLLYLKKARPRVAFNHVFLCLNAPYRCLHFSNSISAIVRAALSHAGITNPPSRGANLLRHSMATTMLRNGATLENVSAVLRHRSLDMTSYYAKVDVNMLMQITQPWSEGAPC